MVRKGNHLCCRMKSSRLPPLRLLGEIVCGHADVCEVEHYRCEQCGRTSKKEGTCHGKRMRLVKEERIV